MNNSTKLLFVLAAGWLTATVSAQDRIHYTGTELSNPAYHDGQLSPVVGVHNIQLVRANRENLMHLTVPGGLIITSRCWHIGTGSFIISTCLTLRMSTSRLRRLS